MVDNIKRGVFTSIVGIVLILASIAMVFVPMFSVVPYEISRFYIVSSFLIGFGMLFIPDTILQTFKKILINLIAKHV